MIHFGLIFIWCDTENNFIFMRITVVWYYLLEGLLFPWVFGIHFENQLTICEGVFLDLSSVPLVYISICISTSIFLIFIVVWKSEVESSNFVLFQDELGILGSLDFHMNFRTSLLIPVKKKAVAILMRCPAVIYPWSSFMRSLKGQRRA